MGSNPTPSATRGRALHHDCCGLVSRAGLNGSVAERALNADDVVSAALDLLDEVGLGGFTMRALAQRLGTYPATIYWHVGSRGDVLTAASARVLRELIETLPDDGTRPWDEWIADFARAYRRMIHAHPAFGEIAVSRFDVEVLAPDVLERLVGVLARGGFHESQLVGAYNALIGSLGGWVAMEVIAPTDGEGYDEARMATSVHELPAGEYPTIVANLGHLADRAFTFRWHGGVGHPMDDAFEFVLRVWIDGLRVQLERGP